MKRSVVSEQTDLSGASAHEVVFISAFHRLLIPRIDSRVHRLGVSETIHDEQELSVLFVFPDNKRNRLRLRYLRFSGLRISVPDPGKIGSQDFCHGVALLQDILVAVDICDSLIVFFDQSFQFQSDQFVETHIKDRVCLCLRESQLCRHDLRLFASESDPAGFTVYKAVLDGLTISGAPQDLDDQINDIDRFDQSLLDLPLFALLFEKILILSRSRLIEEVRVGFEDFPKAQSFGSAVSDR